MTASAARGSASAWGPRAASETTATRVAQVDAPATRRARASAASGWAATHARAPGARTCARGPTAASER
eukprot:2569027-Rhodomonas_salina.2